MQAIVADTTPLNYLILIQAANIPPNLYRNLHTDPGLALNGLDVCKGVVSPTRHNPFVEIALIALLGGVRDSFVRAAKLSLVKVVG